MKSKTTITGILTTIALLAVLGVGLLTAEGCQSGAPFSDPVEVALIASVNESLPYLTSAAERGVEAWLADGEINEAGAELYRREIAAHAQSLATARSQGQ